MAEFFMSGDMIAPPCRDTLHFPHTLDTFPLNKYYYGKNIALNIGIVLAPTCLDLAFYLHLFCQV